MKRFVVIVIVILALAGIAMTVFIRRGPWGTWIAEQRGAGAADARIDSLLELPGILVLPGQR